jgi:hypothetical protein
MYLTRVPEGSSFPRHLGGRFLHLARSLTVAGGGTLRIVGDGTSALHAGVPKLRLALAPKGPRDQADFMVACLLRARFDAAKERL